MQQSRSDSNYILLSRPKATSCNSNLTPIPPAHLQGSGYRFQAGVASIDVLVVRREAPVPFAFMM